MDGLVSTFQKVNRKEKKRKTDSNMDAKSGGVKQWQEKAKNKMQWYFVVKSNVN